MNDQVSVVMCVKNGERFLAEALQSIDDQHHRPEETLVIDGGSTDRTIEIAAAFPSCTVLQQQGSTLSDAYNTGIQAARGDLIGFLSHDDRWRPDKLALQVDALAKQPTAGYCVGHVEFFLQGTAMPNGFRPELLDGRHPGKMMETLLARRSTFDQVGALDPGLPIAHDVDWFARATDIGVEEVMLDAVLVDKRIHDSNTSMAAHDDLLLIVAKRSIQRKRARSS